MVKLFKNLKMLIKLVLVIIFVAIFIEIVGFIGLSDMNKIKNTVMIVHGQNLVSIVVIDDLNQNHGEIAKNLNHLAYNQKPVTGENEKIIKEINELTEQNLESFDKVKIENEGIRSVKNKEEGEKDKNTLEQIDELSGKYLNAINATIKFV